MTRDIFMIKLVRFLCPLWEQHVENSWNFEAFDRPYWICKYCRLKDVGLAYRRTLEKYNS